MQWIETPLNDLWILEPKVHGDHRGFFLESYRNSFFEDRGLTPNFVQDNHARSKQKGVLRGLHFQTAPHAQSKLVRVTRGAVYDAVVDLRRSSSTFGKWFGLELSEDNFRMLWVPQGFAHGYCTLTEDTEFLYKVDALYSPESEGGILWNDPDLQIEWPVSDPILSDKDKVLPPLKELPPVFD